MSNVGAIIAGWVVAAIVYVTIWAMALYFGTKIVKYAWGG